MKTKIKQGVIADGAVGAAQLAGDSVTVNNIVTGNTCGRIGVSNTTRCLVRGNIANSIDVTGSHTGTVTTGNLVSWVMT